MTLRDELAKRRPFDAGDPFDAAADMFRRQVAEMTLEAVGQPPLSHMDGHRQIEAMIAGVMTGLVGSCFGLIEPAGHTAVMKAIKNYLPQARANAEDIVGDGEAAEGKKP